ncbi:signal peptidase II [Nocardia ninae]|uniref:Lipoprotein signal peptidase n=1 Tax=Nocardia ninae NBRC 108245 TaxID=1210091 RepID=A0A511M7A1_9NOCA|nr:signal peptidase II [Nocardia ninae]GEM36489.1 lipoprotein signal peptidase [Nocardia ninae NBRC 108245]
MTVAAASTRPRNARKIGLIATAAGFAGVDLAAKAWAVRGLDSAPIDAWPVNLRLAFNSGAAFSIADDSPAWVMVAVTAAITVAVAIAGWRIAPRAGIGCRMGLAAILGGATANVIDRIPDGKVTDYLHTGWWPTFNLADTFIVLGAITLVTLTMFGDPHERQELSSDD